MQESGRLPMVTGWSVFAVSCLLVAVGAALRGDGPAPFGEDAVLAVGFTALGALVLSGQPTNRAGLLCLTPVLAAVAYAAESWAESAPGRGLSGGVWAGWVAQLIWLPGLLPVLSALLLLLPDGRLPGPRWGR